MISKNETPPANFDQLETRLKKVTAIKKHKIISLFSGCGGMDLGFIGAFKFGGRIYKRLPFKVIWSNDLNPAACQTYTHNLGHEIHCGDIREKMDTLPCQADVVMGGFPCQDVSINGDMSAENGVRTNLYKMMQKVVNLTRPRIFIAENVKGIMMSHSTALFKDMMQGFETLGYHVDARVYVAADYGVPQARERVFIIGVRKGEKYFTSPIAPLNTAEWITAEQAISDLAGMSENKKISHIWSKAKPSADQGSRKLKANKPSTTIRAECHGNIQFHYELDRRLSMREAARLQSFPDSFTFCSGIRQTERQIGNAVPPVLAWHIACAVQEWLG